VPERWHRFTSVAAASRSAAEQRIPRPPIANYASRARSRINDGIDFEIAEQAEQRKLALRFCEMRLTI
jgi:hypothetical protein